MTPGLSDRFLGVALGSFWAEAIAHSPPLTAFPPSLSLKLWQQLAEDGYGVLNSDGISPFHLSSLSGLNLLRDTMPLAVFFHDEPSQWVQGLGLTPQSQILLKAWGQIVAGILTERLVCEGDRGLSQLRLLLSPPALALLSPVLERLESAIKTEISASDFFDLINSDHQAYSLEIAIALGLFSVWNTTDNFRLAVLRSLHMTADSSLVALTGALAGAGLGVSSIPWAWTRQCSLQSSQTLLFETMESVWFHWLGCARKTTHWRRSDASAIASASTLQPRPQLRLVSQTPIR